MGTQELAEFISTTAPSEDSSKKPKSALVKFIEKKYSKGASQTSKLFQNTENDSGQSLSEFKKELTANASEIVPDDIKDSENEASEIHNEKAHRVLGKKNPYDEAKALRVLGESRRLNQVIPPPSTECISDKKKRNPFHKIQKILGIKKKKSKKTDKVIQKQPEIEQEISHEEPIEVAMESLSFDFKPEEQEIKESTTSISSYTLESTAEEEPVQGPLPQEPFSKLIYQPRKTPILIRLYRSYLGWYDQLLTRWNHR